MSGGRAVIYARISDARSSRSKDRDVDDAPGVERQIEDCRRIARQSGMVVLAEVIDESKSAYRRGDHREGWAKVVKMAASGEIDTIVAWKVDRCYRRVEEYGRLLRELDGRPLTILTEGATLDLTGASGRGLAAVLSSLGQMESELKSERIVRKHEDLAAHGKYHGGRRPFGYAKDGRTLDVAEAEALRGAARELIGGRGLAATCRWLRSEHGLEVGPVALKRALLAPRIVGRRSRFSQRDRDRWDRERRAMQHSGEPMPFDGEGRDVLDMPVAEWPPILDVDEWRAVRAKLTGTQSAGSRPSRAPRSLLGGIIRCGSCGAVMGHSATSYKCSSGAHGGSCGKVSVSTPAIEGFIKRVIEEVIQHGRPFEIADEGDPGTAGLQAESRRIAERMESLGDLFADGTLSAEQVRRAKARLAGRKAEIEARLDTDAHRRQSHLLLIPMVEAWGNADQERQGMVIRSLLSEIRVAPSRSGRASGPVFDPGRVELLWRR